MNLASRRIALASILFVTAASFAARASADGSISTATVYTFGYTGAAQTFTVEILPHGAFVSSAKIPGPGGLPRALSPPPQ